MKKIADRQKITKLETKKVFENHINGLLQDRGMTWLSTIVKQIDKNLSENYWEGTCLLMG